MTKSTLLTLPLEIREKIWKYTCDDSVVTLSLRDCYRPGGRGRLVVAEYNRSEILFVCRQIYAEAWTLFMRSSQIRCEVGIKPYNLLRLITTAWLDNIVDLEIFSDKNQALVELPKRLRSLKILRLYVPYVPLWGCSDDTISLRQLLGLEVLDEIQGEARIVGLMHQCPSIDITCSTVVLLGGEPDSRGLRLAYLAEFTSQNMTITFQYRGPWGDDIPDRRSRYQGQFKGEEYAVEPKLVEPPTLA